MTRLVTSFTVGALRCHALEGGTQWLDGGAMFGVVPWPLWSRRVTPDAAHRIPLAMRCLLVEHPDGLVLVDTALGDKDDAKFHRIYGVTNAGDPGPTQLEDAIRAAGHAPADVRWVVNTHLHFDHAGGNTLLDGPAGAAADGAPAVRLAFPNATYVVQRGELEFARHANERTRASYLPANYEPIAAAGRWHLLEGDAAVLPGIRVRVTPGHVPWHQAVLIEDGGETAAFVADLIPTTAHLPLPWIMGYDLEPLRSLESKRALLADALHGGWRLVFEHDPVVATARLGGPAHAAELVDAQRLDG
ncbi:MAG: MBL fold metallo-hydrolase [Gemmatimonadales bacterium]|nr:MBL fold metallo-hydrolase [Gemmatimonadales bacterium]